MKTIDELKEQAIDCIRQIGNAHLNRKEQKIDDVFSEQSCALLEIEKGATDVWRSVYRSKEKCKR